MAHGVTLAGMWLLILLAIVAVCAVLYVNRTKILARALGQSETRVNRHLRRRNR